MLSELHVLWNRLLLDWTSILTAVPLSHISAVRFLVHKYPHSPTNEDEDGNTPLHLASCHGKTEAVDFLINNGAKVDARYIGACGIKA